VLLYNKYTIMFYSVQSPLFMRKVMCTCLWGLYGDRTRVKISGKTWHTCNSWQKQFNIRIFVNDHWSLPTAGVIGCGVKFILVVPHLWSDDIWPLDDTQSNPLSPFNWHFESIRGRGLHGHGHGIWHESIVYRWAQQRLFLVEWHYDERT